MSQKKWFEIKNAKEDSVAKIYIYSEIGEWGVSASDFANEFNRIESDEIELHIDSVGGYVHMGIAIYNIMKQSNKTVVAYVDGVAASIASVIALAADKVIIPDNALFMIHEAWGVVGGGSEDFRKEADLIEKINNQIANIYVEKTGKKLDEVLKLMKEETWYNGTEAVEAGFADDVSESLNIAAKHNIDKSNFKNLDKYNVYKKLGSVSNSKVLEKAEIPKLKPNKEEAVMNTVEELKEAHPELCNKMILDATEKALKAEGERVASINALNSKGTEAIISAAMSDRTKNAGDVAMEILAQQKRAGEAAINELQEDGKNVAEKVNQISSPGEMGDEESKLAEQKQFDKECAEGADEINKINGRA